MRTPSQRRGPKPVILGSIALFAVLFALIAFQVGGGAASGEATREPASTSREAEPSLTATGDDDDGYYEEVPVEEEVPYEEEAPVEEAPPPTTGAS